MMNAFADLNLKQSDTVKIVVSIKTLKNPLVENNEFKNADFRWPARHNA